MKVEIKLEKSRRRKEARRNKGLNSYKIILKNNQEIPKKYLWDIDD